MSFGENFEKHNQEVPTTNEFNSPFKRKRLSNYR